MTIDLRELHRLTQRQHGVFSRGQAARLGLSESTWFRWRRSGRIVECSPGVAHFVGTSVSFHGSVLAAQLGSPSPTVVSHRTAAMLHGCWSEKLGPVQIELSGGRLVDTNRRDAIIHRPRDFGKIVPVRLHGVPTTDALRTLTDLGQVVTDDVLRSTIFAFLRKRKVTIPGLKAVATHRSARGRVGASAVIRVLARNVSDAGFTASELEYEVLEAVSTAGLPAPMLNFRIVIGGQTYLVDLAWPEFRVAAELDSAEFHADQFDEDRERDVNLKLAGWEVHRFTWKHATQKRQWMVNAMLETLRSRGLAA